MNTSSESKLAGGVKTLPVGSVSEGTHRPEDLIPRFMRCLESVDPKHAQRLRDEYHEVFAWLADPSKPEPVDEVDWLLNERLFDVLQDYCPADHYFGSHPGDGADFGVWRLEGEDEP